LPTSLPQKARWPDVAALEDVAHHMIGSVLALCSPPQCGKQLCSFVDDVAAGLGVVQLVGVASISCFDPTDS
jgi:hypothetical protein